MGGLRDLMLEAHGIARWKAVKTINADLAITGVLWARKGWPDALKSTHVTIDVASQRASYAPFTAPHLRSAYTPDQVAVETLDGKVIKERSNPRASFEGHTVETAWDELHLAYFSGYAIWNYLTTPFLFAQPGFATEEIEPWDEQGERRRRLKVTFPASIATHCPEQVYHVGGDGLISRLDYGAAVTGGIPTAHYTSEYQDIGGVKLATKRRAYRRNPDGTPMTAGTAVAIDLANIRLS